MSELIKAILSAAGMLGILGLIFGILLAFAAKVFFVHEDERKVQVEACLPGANCGGCGYAGCSAYAEAIVSGKSALNKCGAGGSETAERIAQIMGAESQQVERKYARVRCSGTNEFASSKYMYQGLVDCTAANRLLDGYLSCKYGCIGFGSCAKVCPNDCISIRDGVAVVDQQRCTGCGKCVGECPKHIIDLIPESAKFTVACSSKHKGAKTKKNCSIGCIGCKMCEKNCPYGAISVVDNIASIDFEKCNGCGICAEKCPSKIIDSAFEM